MADNPNNGGNDQPSGTGQPVGADMGPQIGLIAQYIKDLSFENPNAPQSLQANGAERPQIDVTINVNARRVGDEGFEVELKTSITAKAVNKNAFIVELVYAGLFGVRNMPEENLEPFLLIECPRLIFPFARRIIADVTRDGGFPPLMLDPVDFAYLYQQQRAQAGQAMGPAEAPKIN
jgi:preprotein translocase subunit SecB